MHTIDTTETVVIGAGHAGLAISRCLTERGIDHVVLERGRLAERWRSARWDSFHLLTPSWLARLPHWRYEGTEPDGYLSAAEFVAYLDRYARSFGAPVRDRTTVIGVRQARGGYLVETDRGDWWAPTVVIATGYHARAWRSAGADRLPVELAQVTPAGYRNPGQLPPGGVLVVGASASGVQIAAELNRSGRPVLLSVGTHTRLPRCYRGHDILWWLQRTGSLDRTLDELPDPAWALREPSMQLTAGEHLDLAVLRERGVRLAGRLAGIDAATVRFAGDLPATTGDADTRLRRVLARIDRYAGAAGLAGRVPPGHRPPAIHPAPGPTTMDLRRAGIATVVWATGYRPHYPWLRVDVLDERGHLRHARGVTPSTGLYAIGLRFQHRRNATFIDGARHDATYLADQIATRLARRDPVAGRRDGVAP